MKAFTYLSIFMAAMFLATATSAYAKGNGEKFLYIDGGLNFSNMNTTPSITPTSTMNFLGALGLELGFSEHFAMLLEGRYITKGAKDSSSITYLFSYIEPALLFKLKLSTGKFRPFLVAGGTYGFLMSGTQTTAAGVSTDLKANGTLKTSDYGVEGGLGFEFNLGKMQMFIEGNYSMGLANINTSNTWNNTGIRGIVGFKFHL